MPQDFWSWARGRVLSGGQGHRLVALVADADGRHFDLALRADDGRTTRLPNTGLAGSGWATNVADVFVLEDAAEFDLKNPHYAACCVDVRLVVRASFDAPDGGVRNPSQMSERRPGKALRRSCLL